MSICWKKVIENSVFIQTFRPKGLHQCFILPNLLHDDDTSEIRLAAASDKVYQLLAHGRWFSPVSATTKTGRHNIAEILLKVALNTKKSNQIKSNLRLEQFNRIKHWWRPCGWNVWMKKGFNLYFKFLFWNMPLSCRNDRTIDLKWK